MSSAIVLLSGGLDSVVSLALVRKMYSNILAIIFDYGQKAFEQEFNSSKKICEFYGISYKIITLNWLKECSNSSLNQKNDIPHLSVSDLENSDVVEKSAKSVWVPNRNALFVNIAACYAETMNYDAIVLGANKEEGTTFKDNTKEFILAVNNSLKNSINNTVELIAPLIDLTKTEIVNKGIDLNVPFDLIYSCYSGDKKHCGKCESCQRLKRALKLNNRIDILDKLF